MLKFDTHWGNLGQIIVIHLRHVLETSCLKRCAFLRDWIVVNIIGIITSAQRRNLNFQEVDTEVNSMQRRRSETETKWGLKLRDTILSFLDTIQGIYSLSLGLSGLLFFAHKFWTKLKQKYHSCLSSPTQRYLTVL